MDCLDILTKVSIWTTLGCVYFTSKIYKKMFVKPEQLNIFGKPDESISGLNLIDFLIIIVSIEHLMMIF
jgi:hypothetical protein